MNRHDILRKYLMGEIKQSDIEPKLALWTLDHKPLRSPSISSLKGRRLNPFLVGSDPEFVFMHPDGSHKLDSAAAGLKVGLAAGADQNERLVELRPAPSRSIVEHVAGILTALRWLHRVYGTFYAGYLMRAGAYYAGDGIGGHVHFGRKRATRPEEIAALDGLATAIMWSGLVPRQEWVLRTRGDALGQIYGGPGDFRKQKHGYEYRALPSWLQSPTVAFICLTLSKLAVLDPAVTTSWFKDTKFRDPDCNHNMLRGLAKLYKGRDDDAYILYHVLTRNRDEVFVVNHGVDFSKAWGLPNKASDVEASYILPASIDPDPSEVEEILGHLMFQMPLTFRALPPKFKFALPKNYLWAPARVKAGRRSGFGDFLHNLVFHKDTPFYFEHSNTGNFYIRGPLVAGLSESAKMLLREVDPHVKFDTNAYEVTNGHLVMVTKNLCQTDKIGQLRDVLLHSGLFPLWTVESVTEGSHEKWKHSNKIAKWRRI